LLLKKSSILIQILWEIVGFYRQEWKYRIFFDGLININQFRNRKDQCTGLLYSIYLYWKQLTPDRDKLKNLMLKILKSCLHAHLQYVHNICTNSEGQIFNMSIISVQIQTVRYIISVQIQTVRYIISVQIQKVRYIKMPAQHSHYHTTDVLCAIWTKRMNGPQVMGRKKEVSLKLVLHWI
jgi:hypothetical protein